MEERKIITTREELKKALGLAASLVSGGDLDFMQKMAFATAIVIQNLQGEFEFPESHKNTYDAAAALVRIIMEESSDGR